MAFDAFNQLTQVDLTLEGLTEFSLDSLLNFLRKNEFKPIDNTIMVILYAKISDAAGKMDSSQINLALSLLDNININPSLTVEELVEKIKQIKDFENNKLKQVVEMIRFMKDASESIAVLDIKERNKGVSNTLFKNGIRTLGQIYNYLYLSAENSPKTPNIRNLGEVSLSHLLDSLKQYVLVNKNAIHESYDTKFPELHNPISSLNLKANLLKKLEDLNIAFIKDIYYLFDSSNLKIDEVIDLDSELTSKGLPSIQTVVPLFLREGLEG